MHTPRRRLSPPPPLYSPHRQPASSPPREGRVRRATEAVFAITDLPATLPRAAAPVLPRPITPPPASAGLLSPPDFTRPLPRTRSTRAKTIHSLAPRPTTDLLASAPSVPLAQPPHFHTPKARRQRTETYRSRLTKTGGLLDSVNEEDDDGKAGAAEFKPQMVDDGVFWSSQALAPAASISPPQCDSCSYEARPGDVLTALDPCGHLACRACLSSSLGIVAAAAAVQASSSPIHCGRCHRAVSSFRLLPSLFPSERAKTLFPPLSPETELPAAAPPTPSAPRAMRVALAASQAMAKATSSGAPTAYDPIAYEAGGLSRKPARSDESPAVGVSSIGWPVVKVSNIPWDITPARIEKWLPAGSLPPAHLHPHSVHIIMDRNDGKTAHHMYIELASQESTEVIISTMRNTLLGSENRARYVNVTLASQDELLSALFPTWQGSFELGRPSFSNLNTAEANEVVFNGFISPKEVQTLIDLCERVGAHAIQKMPPKMHFCKARQNPFNDLISILVKLPWTALVHEKPGTGHRHTLFCSFKAAISILKKHLEAQEEGLDQHVLARMVTAASLSPAFSEHQKFILFKLSGLKRKRLPEYARPVRSNRVPQSENVSPSSTLFSSLTSPTLPAPLAPALPIHADPASRIPRMLVPFSTSPGMTLHPLGPFKAQVQLPPTPPYALNPDARIFKPHIRPTQLPLSPESPDHMRALPGAGYADGHLARSGVGVALKYGAPDEVVQSLAGRLRGAAQG